MEPIDETLDDRARARGWKPLDGNGWALFSPDGLLRADVRPVPEGFEARVTRQQAEPIDGVTSQAIHGPELFECCDDALDYAEGGMQAGGPSPPAL